MTTAHTPVPVPTTEASEVTETSGYWPTVYAVIGGSLALLIGATVGVAKLHNPWIFSLTFMVVLVSLWGFQHLKVLNSQPARGLALIVVGGLSAVAPLSGYVLYAFRQEPFPLILVLIVSVIGSVGLLLALAYQAPIRMLVCLLMFIVTLAFMGQHSLIYQHDHDQQRVIEENCDIFPGDPACQ